jgi:ADP-ribosyl-[dinitrogen reductase] hydrolase
LLHRRVRGRRETLVNGIAGLSVKAEVRYKESGDPLSGSSDALSAGNGSIMRLAPEAMFYRSNAESAVRFCGESSRTTHGAAECIDACAFR